MRFSRKAWIFLLPTCQGYNFYAHICWHDFEKKQPLHYLTHKLTLTMALEWATSNTFSLVGSLCYSLHNVQKWSYKTRVFSCLWNHKDFRFLTASNFCGSGLKNDFVVVVCCFDHGCVSKVWYRSRPCIKDSNQGRSHLAMLWYTARA